MTNEGMSNDGVRAAPASPAGRRYDLEERTARFGEGVIDFLKTVRVRPLTQNMIDQLARSSTSVGANYCEADDAGSPAEFRHRISLCKRESRESQFWLRMIARAAPDRRDASRTLWREAKELNLIFAAIHRKLPKPAAKRPPRKPR